MNRDLEHISAFGRQSALLAGLPGVIVGMVQSFCIVADSPVQPTIADLIPPILNALLVTLILLPAAMEIGWIMMRRQR
jgi:hypothetical protein